MEVPATRALCPRWTTRFHSWFSAEDVGGLTVPGLRLCVLLMGAEANRRVTRPQLRKPAVCLCRRYPPPWLPNKQVRKAHLPRGLVHGYAVAPSFITAA